MGDNSKVSALRKYNVLMTDEPGSQIKLNPTRVIKGMTTIIISLFATYVA